MRFAEPWAFLALLLVPVAVVAWLWRERRRQRQIQVAGDLELLGRMTGLGVTQGRGARAWETGLVALALALVAVALARPQFGSRTDVRRARGMDVVVALDLSRSMLARDVTPSRLERAKIELEAMIERLAGDRVGLVGFTSAAIPLCPLTVDHAALVLQLRAAAPEQMPRGGTAIGEAIAEGKRMLDTSPYRESGKAIVIITDGEEHEGDPEGAARDAEEAGIEVHVVGVGSTAGEPIPLPDGTYLRDPTGQTVISRLNEPMLEKVATAGGGVVSMPGPSGGIDLAPVVLRLAQLDKADLEKRTVRIYEERYRWALVPAFVLLLAATLVRTRRRGGRGAVPGGRGTGRGVVATVMAMLLPLLLGAGPLTREQPDVADGNRALADGKPKEALEAYGRAETKVGLDPRLLLDRGLAQAADGELDKAIEAYKAAIAASTDPAVRAQAAFAMGNASRTLKKFDDAIQSYRRALLDDPKHEGARKNLEITSAMKRIQALQPKPPGDDKKKGDGDDKKQDGPQPDAGTNDGGPPEDDGGKPPEDKSDDGGPADAGTGGGGGGADASEGPEAGSAGEGSADATAADATPAEESAPAEEGKEDKEPPRDDSVLDALEAKEKALQAKRRAKGVRPRHVEKDW